MGIGNYFMNTNVDLFHDSTKNSSGILTSESNEMGLSTIFNYNGNNVAFIKTSYGILINATDMARPYNKRPVDYLRQIYVNELVSTIVSQTHISEDQLVIKMRGSSENGGGTWLYEDVAIDFAQWLDVKFKVWCNSKIKELLTTGLVKLPNFNNPPRKPLSLSFRSRLPDPLPHLPDSCMFVSSILVTPPASGWDGWLIFACLS